MKYFQINRLIILFYLIYSCTNEPGNDREYKYIINIDEISKNTDRLHLNKYFDSIKYIPLNIPDSFQLHKINYVSLKGDYLCLADKHKVVLYDTKYKLFTKIGGFGSGPNEYIGVSGVDIGGNPMNIVIKDDYGREILIYNIEERKFIKEFSNNIMASIIKSTENNSFLSYVPYPTYIEKKYSLWLYKFNDNSLRSYWERPSIYITKKINQIFTHEVFQYKNGYGIYENLFNHIIHFNLNNNQITYLIKFNNSKQIDIKISDHIKDKSVLNNLSRAYIIKNICFFEIDSYNLIEYGFYNFINNYGEYLGNIWNDPGMIDNIDLGPNVLPLGLLNDDLIYDFITFEDFEKIKNKSLIKPIIKNNVDELAIDANTNDVLRIVKIKD